MRSSTVIGDTLEQARHVIGEGLQSESLVPSAIAVAHLRRLLWQPDLQAAIAAAEGEPAGIIRSLQKVLSHRRSNDAETLEALESMLVRDAGSWCALDRPGNLGNPDLRSLTS